MQFDAQKDTDIKVRIKARFQYERGMEYSWFLLLIFLLSFALKRKKGINKINKINKECSIPGS